MKKYRKISDPEQLKIVWPLLVAVVLIAAGVLYLAAGRSKNVEETAAEDLKEAAGEPAFGDIMPELEPEPEPEPDPVVIDVLIFAGQSNMAGQGIAQEAPAVIEGAAFEYRAVTDPTRLYPIEEPFGLEENREDGIYDIWEDGTRKKTGDLIPAFVNRYYELTGHVVTAVSASECGTRIDEWLPGTENYEDLRSRIDAAVSYLNGDCDADNAEEDNAEEDNAEAAESDPVTVLAPEENENFPRDYVMGNVYLLWCQGESDGDAHVTRQDYYDKLNLFVNSITEESAADEVMVIRIGNNRDYPVLYDEIMAAQTEVCRDNENAVLISTEFSHMAEEGQMKDIYHYTQGAYDLVGTDAAENMASYVLTGVQPILWDYETDDVYDPAAQTGEIRETQEIQENTENIGDTGDTVDIDSTED